MKAHVPQTHARRQFLCVGRYFINQSPGDVLVRGHSGCLGALREGFLNAVLASQKVPAFNDPGLICPDCAQRSLLDIGTCI
jgi:hypothetical protein